MSKVHFINCWGIQGGWVFNLLRFGAGKGCWYFTIVNFGILVSYRKP